MSFENVLPNWLFAVFYVALMVMGVAMAIRQRIQELQKQVGHSIGRAKSLSKRLQRLVFLLSSGVILTFTPRIPSSMALLLLFLAKYRSRTNYAKIRAISNITDPDRFREVVSHDPELGKIFREASNMIHEEADRYLHSVLVDEKRPLATILSLFLENPSKHTLNIISSVSPIYSTLDDIGQQLAFTKAAYYVITALSFGMEMFLIMIGGLDPQNEILVDALVFVILLMATLIANAL